MNPRLAALDEEIMIVFVVIAHCVMDLVAVILDSLKQKPKQKPTATSSRFEEGVLQVAGVILAVCFSLAVIIGIAFVVIKGIKFIWHF